MYRKLIELAPEPILVHSGKIIVYVNPACAKLFGVSAKALVGKPMLDFIHPDDHALANERIRQIEQDRTQTPLSEQKYVRPDGQIIYATVTGIPTTYLGKPATQMIILDTTERRQIENTLRESEERYRRVVEMSPAAMAIHSEGKFVFVNPAGAELIGASSPEELIGRSILEIVHPAYRSQVIERVQRLAAGQAAPLTEEKFIRLDGTPIDVEVAAIPFTYQGKPATQVIVRDITERKRAAETNARLAAIVQSSFDAILSKTLDGILTSWNAAAEQMYGYTADEMIGQSISRVIPPERPTELADILTGIARGEEIHRFETVRVRKNGTRFDVSVSISPVRDATGKIVGASTIAHDISERKRTEQALRRYAAHQTALNGIIAAATDASTDLGILMETVLDLSLKAFGLDIGAIWIGAAPAEKSATVLLGVTFEIAEAIARAAELGQRDGTALSVVIDWDDAPDGFELVRAHGMRSSVTVPLLAGGERVGGLAIASPMPRAWSREEIELVEAIGRQVGMNVERARLFQETRARAAQLELLYDAGLSLNQKLDLPTLMETMLGITNKLVHADQADFFRLHPVRQVLTLEFGAGYTEDMDVTPLQTPGFAIGDERGLVGRVAADRTPLYVPDVASDPRWIAVDPSRAAFLAPIEYQGNLRGVLTVKSHRLDAFTPSDQRLILLFANQLSVAMENVRLFDETRQRLAELEALNNISVALRVAHTLDEMLPILSKETATVLNVDAVTIWLHNPVTEELNQVAEFGLGHLAGSLQAKEGITGYVFSTGQVYISREFRSDPLTEESVRGQIPPGLGGACLPIRASDQIIGVLFASVRAPRQLTLNEINVLTTIVEMAGNAIHRERLLEQTEKDVQRLDALHRIDIAITSSFDMRVTFNVILDQVVSQLHVDAAGILLFDSLSQMLNYGGGRGFRTSWVSSARLGLGEAHAGRAAA